MVMSILQHKQGNNPGYYACIVILLFFMVSCNKQEYRDATKFYSQDFPETIHLKGMELKFDKELFRTVGLFLIDSVLIVQNYNAETHFVKYNIHTKKKVGESVCWGSGPEEMLNPKGIHLLDSVVWICDVKRRKMMSYSKEQFCYSNMPRPLHSINFKEQFNKVAVNTNNIVSTVLALNYQRLSFFDMNGSFIKTVGEFPDCNLSLTPIETIESFLCNISINPQDGRICLSYNLTDLIEFYDADGILKKRIHGPDHFFPAVAETKKGGGIGVRSIEGKTRDAYFSPVVSDNIIYLLYSGRFFDLNVAENSYLVNQIFVFDWDGGPLKRYILDIPVFWFTVDESQKRIYGLTDAPDYRIIEFRF